MGHETTSADISDTVWRARYDVARSTLDDVLEISGFWRAVQQMDTALPPTATMLAGEDGLRQARRVGLLTGSFNPLTRAHIELAEAARRAEQLDVIVWGCAAVTVDKERVMRATLPDRLAQLAAYARATKGDALTLTNRGLYVDEAAALRAHLAPQADLVIMVGFDKIVQIFDPHYYADRDAALRDLFAKARLLVAPRAHAGKSELMALLRQPENQPFARFVSFVHVPPQYAHDSSTEARDLAAQSADPRRRLANLLPPEGVALACETGVYADISSDADIDRYSWRSHWIAALAPQLGEQLAPQERSSLPRLSALVACACEQTPHGQRVRDMLRESANRSPAPSIAEMIHLCAKE